MKNKIKRFIVAVDKVVTTNEMKILPGQMAFYFILSVIPLIAVIVSIASALSLSLVDVEALIYKSVPQSVADLLFKSITGKSISINIIIFYFSAFLLASNGSHSMILSANSLYKFDNRSYIPRRLKAFIMTVILVILMMFMFIVPIFGSWILKGISYLVSNTAFIDSLRNIYNIFKLPVTVLFIFVCIKVLYTMAPDSKIKSKTTTLGAAFTTIMWVIASEVYSFYIIKFATYDLLYGSLANIIILLLWFYLLAYIFVFGMAINVRVYQRQKQTNN